MKLFKETKILRAILATLILFIPLYPKFPLTSVDNTYVAIRLDDVIIVLTLLVWFIYQVKNKFPVLKLKITKLFIAYFVTITIVNLISYLINQVDPLNILVLHLFRRFEYMSLFFVAVSSIYHPKDLKYPFVALVIATIFASLYGYGQRYFNLPVISTMNEEFSKGQLLTMSVWTRVSSTFAGHYDFAAFLSVVLIIIGGVTVITKKTIYKILLIIVWLVAFQMLTFTASRVSTMSFWGSMILVLVLLRKYLWIVPVSFIVIFSFFNSKDLNQRLLATIPSIKNISFFQTGPSSLTPTPIPPSPTPTISSKPTQIIGKYSSPTPTIIRHSTPEVFPEPDVDAGVARSGEIRFNVEWPRAINSFIKNPLIGTGLGSISLATDNDYLRSIGESGILGLLSFSLIIFWFIITSFKLLFQKNRNSTQTVSVILFCALLVQLANAIFIDVFEASKTAYLFWIMMGIYYQSLSMSDHDRK